MILPSQMAALGLYFCMVAFVSIRSWRRSLTSTDFMLGSRQMNFWLTALAAHASDMSSWIFMGYPVLIYSMGLFGGWVAVGLVVFMYLNWTLIAPKLRLATEGYNSLTLSSFFESRLADSSGGLRIISALLSLLFYAVYIASGLVGLGLLIQSLFEISYNASILIGLCIVVPYLFVAGYITLAWIDLVQGTFLLCVILMTPLIIIYDLGGFSSIVDAMNARHDLLAFWPPLTLSNLWLIFCTACAWGLGYFGQPHILTKFMGIANRAEMPKSCAVGISWQSLALIGATLLGVVFMAAYPESPSDKQTMFVTIVMNRFSPFFAMLVLCALLGAVINSIGAFLMVVSSNLAEDFYKKTLRKEASSKELLFVSRLGIFLVALVAALIAMQRPASIFDLVEYAWFGLGSTFGPLILYTLYGPRATKQGAWAGMVVGGGMAALWPLLAISWVPTLIPAFFLGLMAIFVVSHYTCEESA